MVVQSKIPLVLVDVHEKDEMEAGLTKTLTTQRHPLEPLGLADYFWQSKRRHTIEYKTAGAFVSESGGRMDAQLTKYQGNADEIIVLVSGLLTMNPDGSCLIWKNEEVKRKVMALEAKPKSIWIPDRTLHKEYSAVMAYIYSLWNNEGIQTLWVGDDESACMAISSFIYNSLKPESAHETLRKHLKPRIPAPFKPDSYVETLMGWKGAKIGEKTALKLIGRFKDPFSVAVADYDELCACVGEGHASLICKSIGRMAS